MNRVLVEEVYKIEYDYKRKMEVNLLKPSKILDLNIPTKTMIIMRNFGFIYSGYRKESIFWELVVFSRKFMFIFIGNLINKNKTNVIQLC